MDWIIYLKTTETCNLNCKHCYTNGKSGRKIYWDRSKVVDWLTRFSEKISSNDTVHCEFHGGEPFLVNTAEIKDVCKRVKEVIPNVSFGATTNLTYKIKDDQKELIKSYFSIRGWGLPISLVVFGVFGVFRGLQNTYWAMQISLVGMFSNIIVDYLLIFGFCEIIPAFRIEGAAWASVISQGIMLVLAIRFLLTKSKLKLDFTKTLHQGISKLLKMSFDLFLRAAALNVAFYFGTSFAASYGENHIAAYTIGINLWLFSSFFIDGFSNAGNAIGGRLAGEGNLNELKRVGYLLVKVNIGIALMLSLVYLIFYTYLGRFFTQEAEVLMLFEATFWIIIISQPINALAFTLDGIFKGLGHTALLRNVLIGAGVFAFLPAIFILDSFASNLFAIWFAFVFWMLARGLPLLFKFKNLKHV